MTRNFILILDNEHHTRWTLKKLLESEGYITVERDTVEKALKNISKFEISGMVTEYRIGNCFSLNAVKKLKRKFPEAYVMMITGERVTEDEYEEIINAGVNDFFPKPCSIKKILLHLRKGLVERSLILEKSRLKRKHDQTSTKGRASCFPRGQEVMIPSSSQSIESLSLDRNEYH